jgi:hypothetical protein
VRLRAAVVVAALGLIGLTSSQAFAASPNASCVATITSFEASQLERGAVGREVSGLATSAPSIVGSLVSELARAHGGSVDACVGAPV